MDRRRSQARYTAAWRLTCFLGSLGIIYFAIGQLMADGDIGVSGGGIYHSTGATAVTDSSAGSGGVVGSGDGRTDDSVKATAPLESGAAQVDVQHLLMRVIACTQQCQITSICSH